MALSGNFETPLCSYLCTITAHQVHACGSDIYEQPLPVALLST